MMTSTVAPPQWSFYTEPAFLDVRGLRTAFRRNGAGETVVYFHGAGLTRRWLPVYAALAKRVDLLVPEHPGFGDTPMPDWLRGMEDVLVHYDEFFAQLEIERMHIVGHSLGGWIAAKFAAWFPRRVLSLTLIAPAGIRCPEAPMYDFFRMTPDEADEILFNGHAAEYPEYLEFGDDETEAVIQEYLELTATARLMWNPRYDVRLERQLARVSCPALLVGVDDDRLIPRAHCERYVDLLPNARLEVLSGQRFPTSHVLVEEPERLATLIADFVTEGAR